MEFRACISCITQVCAKNFSIGIRLIHLVPSALAIAFDPCGASMLKQAFKSFAFSIYSSALDRLAKQFTEMPTNGCLLSADGNKLCWIRVTRNKRWKCARKKSRSHYTRCRPLFTTHCHTATVSTVWFDNNEPMTLMGLFLCCLPQSMHKCLITFNLEII